MEGAAVLRKMRWRLLPFLFLLYVIAYLDRINVGFAALQMKQQLGFSDTVYGSGASIFFVGYFLFQVPSNMALERFGARRWIALLMVLWGIISASMFLIRSPHSFYALRFLLGAAEAGFFPGVVFYLQRWFPPSARAAVISIFLTAGPVSGLLGSPLSGYLLDFDGRHGLAGWQWMFLMEGIPAIVFGFLTYVFLSETPDDSKWLTPSEKDWIREAQQGETALTPATTAAQNTTSFLWNPRLWAFAMISFGLNTCTYGVSLWLPTAMKAFTASSNILLGLISAIPYLLAVSIMVAVGVHSDRQGERRWHVALSAFSGAMALLIASESTAIVVSVAAYGLALAASSSMAGPFWAMASPTFSASTAARSIALINAIGNLGSGFGPYLIGYLKTITGSFEGGLWGVALVMALAGVLTLVVGRKR